MGGYEHRGLDARLGSGDRDHQPGQVALSASSVAPLRASSQRPPAQVRHICRRLAPAYLWLEDHGWQLAQALATVAILAGLALALAGGGR